MFSWKDKIDEQIDIAIFNLNKAKFGEHPNSELDREQRLNMAAQAIKHAITLDKGLK